ncbi:sugar ABC transporter substrate-binding protein [Rhodococcus pyridinivorans]|uniref:sugar ABC transporter substrate-binding protein n=1 Tax=Rhodococcus pyridinivorans TaxID=103816 RepID=UPI0039B4C714
MAALLMFLFAACSSGASGTESSGETDNAAVTAAQERLAPLLIPVADTKIEVDTPLTQRPPAGKNVRIIRYNNTASGVFDQPMKDAGAALGWNISISPIDATDPQAISNEMIRAASQKVDYIVVTASSIQATGAGMDAAKSAGIPVFFGAGVGEPEGKANGLYGNTMRTTTNLAVLAMLDQMIVDSGGTGSVVLVNAPDSSQILAETGESAKRYVAENCPKCSLEVLDIAAADLGGDIASKVVAKVRQSPNTEYVVTTFSDLAVGLAPALGAAGLDDVKAYLSGLTEAEVDLVRNGTYPAGNLYPINDYPWLLFDQIARHSVGMDTLQKEHDTTGLKLWTTETVPDGMNSWDPPNYQDAYKSLWQIS